MSTPNEKAALAGAAHQNRQCTSTSSDRKSQLNSSDDIARGYRYANTEGLGDKWVEARKLSEKHKNTPHHARYEMAADIARLIYDLACVIKQEAANSGMLSSYLAMFDDLLRRVSILEGAYCHLALASTKLGGPHE